MTLTGSYWAIYTWGPPPSPWHSNVTSAYIRTSTDMWTLRNVILPAIEERKLP